MHGIDYDEVNDEIVVPQQFGQAILTFAGGADGETPPIRYIQGPSTRLKEPDRLAVDGVNNEIFVPEGNQVLVFPRLASGDVAPIRTLDLDSSAGSVDVDPINNLLVVRTSLRQDGRNQAALLIFNRTDQGKAKPKAVISGPNTGLRNVWTIRLYPPRGWILAVEQGTGKSDENSWVGVWSIHDNGDVAPRWRIGGPQGSLRKPRGVTVDAEAKTVIVSDKYLNSVLTYSYPELF